MPRHIWLTLAAINGALAVVAGAFGAHGLEGRVPAQDISTFQTGAHYHMYHALALMAVGVLSKSGQKPAAALSVSGWAFLCGIALFSGSLYVLGITGSRSLVWLTPIGGVAFIVGWCVLAWSVAIRRD